MAKDFYDKLKILSEVLKNNWPLVLMGLTAISSLSANAAQFFGIQEKEQELKDTQQQVAAVANYVTKTVIVKKDGCYECKKDIKTLQSEVNQLKRWH